MPLLARLVALIRSRTRRAVTATPFLYPEADTELDLLLSVATDPALLPTLRTLGVQPEVVQSRLAARQVDPDPETSESLARIRSSLQAAEKNQLGNGLSERSPQEDHLGFLAVHGSARVRQAIEDLGLQPAALAFWLAHRAHESELRRTWPSSEVGLTRVALLNDPYSPMERVHKFLIEAFALSSEKAVELMLRVHREGAVVQDLPVTTNAVSFCDSWNKQWRAAGIPLYVRPCFTAK